MEINSSQNIEKKYVTLRINFKNILIPNEIFLFNKKNKFLFSYKRSFGLYQLRTHGALVQQLNRERLLRDAHRINALLTNLQNQIHHQSNALHHHREAPRRRDQISPEIFAKHPKQLQRKNLELQESCQVHTAPDCGRPAKHTIPKN